MLATHALVIPGKASVSVCWFLISRPLFCARAGSFCGFWAGCSQHLALPSDARGTGRSGRSELGCLSGERSPLPCPPLCFHKPLRFDSGFLKIKPIRALGHEANWGLDFLCPHTGANGGIPGHRISLVSVLLVQD